jgi:hypothetical protein
MVGDDVAAVGVVVGLVQADALRRLLGGLGAVDRDRLDRVG